MQNDWFDKLESSYKGKNETLRSYYFTELAILRAVHGGKIGPNEAALAITRPISESPILVLGTYSDDLLALVPLWTLYTKALDEWPSSRTQDLIDLGLAISKVPDKIHQGETTDDNYEPLTWKDLPYFHMVWSDAHWEFPEDILKENMESSARHQACEVYIKQQKIEAQLVAAGMLGWNRALRALYHVFEREKDDGNEHRGQKMQNEKDGEEGKMIMMEGGEELRQEDLNIRAEGYWVEYLGDRLYSSLKQNEPRWEICNSPVQEMFDQSRPGKAINPWDYWMDQFYIAATESSDSSTREMAKATVERMERIRDKANAV
ncbi:hypothetical protein ACHAPA_011655 [Fusarium lateritium]